MEKHPQDPEAYIGLAQVAVAQEEYDLALVQLAKARHLAPNSPAVLNETVGVYLKDARIDLAIKTAEEALATSSNQETLKLLGAAYVVRGELAKAEAVLKDALQVGPNKEVQSALVDVYARQDQLDKAEAECHNLRERYPNDPQGHIMLARIYAASQNIPKAIAVYEQLLAQHEAKFAKDRSGAGLVQLTMVYSEMVAVYNQERQFYKAIEMCNKMQAILSRVQPTAPDAKHLHSIMQEALLLHLGRAYLGLEDYYNAVGALQGAIRLNPTAAIYHYRLGLAYVGSENYRQAVEAFQQALALRPAFINAHIKLANVYLAQRESKRAIEGCEQVLTVFAPNTEQRAEAHYLSGIAYLELGDDERSTHHLEKVLKLYRGSASIFVASELFSREERLPAILAAYQKIITRLPASASAYSGLAPDSAMYRDTLGWIYYQKQMFWEAIVELTWASQAAPDNPRIHYHLGMAHHAVGEKEKAYQELQVAVTAKTPFPELDVARQMLFGR